MKNNLLHLFFILLFSTYAFSQQFQIGDKVQIKSQHFKFLDFSPSMKVHTYQYIGPLINIFMFQRRVGEVLVGVKNGVVVTTIYNLKLNIDEHRIPNSTLKRVNNAIGKELLFISYNSFAVTKENSFISLKICNTPLTFNQPRIVYLTSVKYSILMP